MTATSPPVVGVNVGDTSRDGSEALLASHKESTSTNMTLSIQATLKALLQKSAVDPADISTLAIGTTHFLNAIIERDTSRVEKVAVICLASYGFSTSTPPFVDWPGPHRHLDDETRPGGRSP